MARDRWPFTAGPQSHWRMKHNREYMPVEASELEEDCETRSKPESAGAAGTKLTRTVRSWRTCFGCGTLVSLAATAVILGVSLSLYEINKPSATSRSSEAAGTGAGAGAGAGLPRYRYPTDFLRDVVPVPCHSHNDYWRDAPLFSALRAGCIGVEADVWLLGDGDGDTTSNNNDSLLVGHDPAALTAERTFRSLYVDPLADLLARANPRTPFYGGGARRGVFDADPAQTLVLLVDVKTDGARTWPRVLEQLAPLREKGWLTHVVDGDDDGGGEGEVVVRERPVTVVGTGNAPFALLAGNATAAAAAAYRDAFFDAPLERLWEDPGSGDVPGPSAGDGAEYDRTNSYYASASFRDAVGPLERGGELSEAQLRAVRGQIRGAHSRGLKARYWETPSWPVGLRNKVWRVLVEEGADILNVDDLRAAAQGVW